MKRLIIWTYLVRKNYQGYLNLAFIGSYIGDTETFLIADALKEKKYEYVDFGCTANKVPHFLPHLFPS